MKSSCRVVARPCGPGHGPAIARHLSLRSSENGAPPSPFQRFVLSAARKV